MTSPHLRYLALGDSYTIGEGVSEQERWPVLLATRLRAEGIPVAHPEIVAATGWTTDELSTAIDEADPQGPYDFVTLLIGVNNQYRGRGADEYRLDFRTLLNRAVAFADGIASHVLVISIPDWGATRFANGRDRENIGFEIDQFNEINREEARSAGYLDITPLSRTQGKMVVEDGLHPNGNAYAAWVEVLLPVAHAQLRSPGDAT